MIDRFFLISFISVAISLVFVMIILIIGTILPARLPLFYSLAWGEGQLASLPQFFIIPAVSTIITLVNLIVAWQLHPSQYLFKQILIFSSLVSTAVMLITFLRIILIFL